jgi:hypothetical protein
MPFFKWLFLNNLCPKTLGQIQNLVPHRLMSRLNPRPLQAAPIFKDHRLIAVETTLRSWQFAINYIGESLRDIRYRRCDGSPPNRRPGHTELGGQPCPFSRSAGMERKICFGPRYTASRVQEYADITRTKNIRRLASVLVPLPSSVFDAITARSVQSHLREIQELLGDKNIRTTVRVMP